MQQFDMKYTIWWMMKAIGMTSWICFNARLLTGIEDDLPSSNATRIFFFRILALVISPFSGCLVAWATWHAFRKSVDSLRRAILYGMSAGAIGGGMAWYCATIILCVGHGTYAQTPLAATILFAEGAAFHAIPSAFVAGVWWLQLSNKTGVEK